MLEAVTGHATSWKKSVATMTLDNFSDAIALKPTLIKIDVDGNELSILKCGEKTPNNPKLESIFIEVDYKNIGCKETLVDYSFVLTSTFGDNQMWNNEVAPSQGQFFL